MASNQQILLQRLLCETHHRNFPRVMCSGIHSRLEPIAPSHSPGDDTDITEPRGADMTDADKLAALIQVNMLTLSGPITLELPELADRIKAEDGFALERVGELYRLAGGRRWRQSVAESDTSTCARALLGWLDICNLKIYSDRAIREASEGNGHEMTRRTLRHLHSQDLIVVVDPRTKLGGDLLAGTLVPRGSWIELDFPEPPALDDRIRLANARDVAAVAGLRTWAPSWTL